jgi:hypothetical protein
MASKKKPREKQVEAAATTRETMVAPPVVRSPGSKRDALDRFRDHVTEHHALSPYGQDNPMGVYNAGGVCGICGERVQ